MIPLAIRRAAPALLLSAVVLVPFLGKPFTIDDPVFMRMAEHALVDPLHPSAFEMAWGEAPGRVGLVSGPVMAWLLVPAALAGGSEEAAHLVQLAMLWVAIAATVALAGRLGLSGAGATASGLLLASAPAVLAMAGTAMPDVPAMALGVLGVERLVAWRADGRVHQAAVAALALALAPLARPHLVSVWGVAALLLWAPLGPERPRFQPRAWVPLLLAPVLAAAVGLIARDPHPDARGFVAAAQTVSSLGFLASNLVAFSFHWVLALPLAVPWAAAQPRTVLARWPAALVAAALMLAHLGLEGRGPALALGAGLAVAVLWTIGADAVRRRDPVQLALGAWLLAGVAAAPYPHLPAKYLLASAPAAAILVARAASTRSAAIARVIVGATCAAGVLLGVGILRADAAFGEVGRRAVAQLVAPRVAAGQRVWFVGTWGFQWYAEEAGARPATLAPPHPEPGDFLVVSLGSARSEAVLQRIAMSHPAMTQVAQITDVTPGGRIMNKRLGVGFYSNRSGLLPWVWSGGAPLDVILGFQL